MKKQLLKTYLLAGITLIFIACSSGGGDKAADTTAETDVEETTEEATEESADVLPFSTILTAWHQVDDYDKWKSVYDEVEHGEDTDGLEKLLVGQEDGNPNHVMVGEIVHNMDLAKAFFDSERFSTAVEESGVVGETELQFNDVVYIGPPSGENPKRIMLQFSVSDFAAFVDVFQRESQAAGNPDRDEGITLQFMGRGSEDPNSVVLIYILDDREKMDAHLDREEWKAALEEATADMESVAVYYYTLKQYNYTDES